MKYRVDIVKTDEAGNEISRITAGEYEFEFEAVIAVSEEDRKLKASGENGYVNMLMIEEKGDNIAQTFQDDDEDEDPEYTPDEYLQFEYDRVKGADWQTLTFSIDDEEMQNIARMENQKSLLELIEESPAHKLISLNPSTEDEIKKQLNLTYQNYKPMILNRKLNPKSMRWAYDGGGFACGPVEGSFITEILFHDSENRPYFVSASRMSEFVNVYVSEVSLFDLLLWAGIGEANIEDYMQKIEKYSIAEFDTELGEYDDILGSEYRDEMILVLAMNNYYIHHDTENPDPEEMLEVARDKQFNIGLPMGWGYDDEEEEDDE